MYLHGQNLELNSMVAACEQYEVIPSFQQSFLINCHHNCHFRLKQETAPLLNHLFTNYELMMIQNFHLIILCRENDYLID
jgi:hypothetical protein